MYFQYRLEFCLFIKYNLFICVFHGQKLYVVFYLINLLSIVKNEPLTCFKMMLPYILNLIENKKIWLTLIFWCFIKLNDTAFQRKKNEILQLTRSKVMALTSEQEIAADNGMWLTYPSHLE